MQRVTAYDAIAQLQPCRSGAEWAQNQPDVHTAWRLCHRADWMLWYLSHVYLSNFRDEALEKKLVACVLAIVEPYLRYSVHACVPSGSDKIAGAVEAVEAWLWLRNKPTTQELQRLAFALSEDFDLGKFTIPDKDLEPTKVHIAQMAGGHAVKVLAELCLAPYSRGTFCHLLGRAIHSTALAYIYGRALDTEVKNPDGCSTFTLGTVSAAQSKFADIVRQHFPEAPSLPPPVHT